jgi:hypothetical protein
MGDERASREVEEEKGEKHALESNQHRYRDKKRREGKNYKKRDK